MPEQSTARTLTSGAFLCGLAVTIQLYAPQAVLSSISADTGSTPATSALLMSATTIGLAVGGLIWVVLAQRLRLSAVLMAAGFVSAALLIVLAFVPSLPLMIAARLVEGAVLSGASATIFSYVASHGSAADALRAGAGYVMGTTIGGLGRLLAGALTEWIPGELGWRLGLASLGIVSLLACLGYALILPRDGAVARDDIIPVRAHVATFLRTLARPRLLALFLQGFLLMGAFVATYNFVSFRLAEPPFSFSPTIVSLFYLTLLAGTAGARISGRLGSTRGRWRVLVVATTTMLAGALILSVDSVPTTVLGLIGVVGGFFAAHTIASGWVAQEAGPTKRHAGAVYNFAYYGGSSLLGWLGGLFLQANGWTGLVVWVVVLSGGAMLAGILFLRPGARTEAPSPELERTRA